MTAAVIMPLTTDSQTPSQLIDSQSFNVVVDWIHRQTLFNMPVDLIGGHILSSCLFK